MEGRALGKGLSALIPAQTVSSNQEKQSGQKEGVNYIETSRIRNNRLQPRSNYSEESLSDLKASIREKGILQPILVRKHGEDYEVVAGERRLRAARALELEKIPVIIKSMTDKDCLVVALIENIQREELNPIEEAEAFRRLIEEFDYTQETVAQSVGKDRSTISNLLRLLKLPPDMQKSVYDGSLSVGHGRALLGAESPIQRERLYLQTIDKGWSVRALEQAVKAEQAGIAQKIKPVETKNHEIVALEDDLQKALGTKVSVKAKKKRGKIIIDYYSLDDLDRIIQMIKQ